MSTTTMQLQARWARLAPRERSLLTGAALLMLGALLWWGALAPALRTVRAAEARHQALDRQWQQVQSLKAQAERLQAQPRTAREDAVRALQDATATRLGTSTRVDVVGERVTVILKGVSPDAVAQWLAQARGNARATPAEARLIRSAASPAPSAGNGGASAAAAAASAARWDGTVVLSLPPAR